MPPRVLTAILFSPRGGSAPAARALVGGLRKQGWSVTLLAGSRGDHDAHGDAGEFYGDDVRAVGFDAALESGSPMDYDGPLGNAPMHPSFEDRPAAPDRVFASLDDDMYERQVRAWSRELKHAGAAGADVLHLHHLTPLNEAAARVAPHVPVVGQLHGTELLMLEQIAAGAPAGWAYAERWAARMRGWARRCARLIVAPAAVQRALNLLEVPRDHVVAVPNGVDIELFQPLELDREAFWRSVLVEQPRGWLPGESAGSVHYSGTRADALSAGAVLLYVGRFTAVKRLDRLIDAFGRAQERLRTPAGLVLVGGHPGEWEGEHPVQIAARLGVPHVFLAGWHRHEELPPFFSAADAVVLTSEREQFGQVLVEGMACGLPAVATRSLGPAMIIEDRETGWLVEPGDREALASALVEVVQDGAERRRRGARALAVAHDRYSWAGAAGQVAEVLADVAGGAKRISAPLLPIRAAPPASRAPTVARLSSRLSERPGGRGTT